MQLTGRRRRNSNPAPPLTRASLQASKDPVPLRTGQTGARVISAVDHYVITQVYAESIQVIFHTRPCYYAIEPLRVQESVNNHYSITFSDNWPSGTRFAYHPSKKRAELKRGL